MQKNRPIKRLYSIRDVSIYLGRSECAIREMIWSGKLPSVKFDRRIYIDINDLDELIQMHKTRTSY